MSYIKLTSYNMYYKQNGKGQQDLVLLHNAGGDHSFLSPQIKALSQTYRITAIDFLGHGHSSQPTADILTIPVYAEHVFQLCKQLNLKKITLIGLNYGANVAAEFFHRHESLVDNIIMIDPPILISKEVNQFIRKHIDKLGHISQTDYAKELISHSFIKASEQLKEKAYNVFKQTSHDTMKAVYTDLLNWDKEYAINRISHLPESTLCILTDASLCDEHALKKHNEKIIIAKVVASKYWATLEVPEQINTMILRFLDLQL